MIFPNMQTWYLSSDDSGSDLNLSDLSRWESTIYDYHLKTIVKSGKVSGIKLPKLRNVGG